MTFETTFSRLVDVPTFEIAKHMSDPRVAEHMPLLKGAWDTEMALKFVKLKEE